jgi:uncharacterized circularly permuted ATP-grasp superfamily protein
MGLDQLTRRWQTGQQLIQANGVTYNVYGDPQGRERPWVLDPIPLAVSEEDWAHIERAIIQRATLLNAVLADLYGERRLIQDRQLPPALLFSNPNFLRPCFGIKPPGGVFLHSYAADLGRSEDGQWWVIADRTQAPSGLGYALENRYVSARTLPAAFNRSRVRPLIGFLDVQREALQALAPNHRDHPRIVLLTPGPENETYFEHSFLARHWGFPLVEGADLTIRDSRVFLKTLTGLEPVDLILRRMDDSFCDPLELRGESVLGVPGLTQAVRAGHVAIANALGSGLLETSSPMAFLPGLCRALLGEELRMPSVATWWCGHEAERRFVLSHLPDLVIKPAFRRAGEIPVFPATLSSEARQQLAAKIEAAPEEYIAQEQISLSTAPVRTDSGIVPRHVVLRVFACWDGQSYSVLPGGLTRVSMEASSPIVSMQAGGGSKDTWVLSSSEDSSALRAFPGPDLPALAASPLASRQADNLFWLGRYVERVEGGVRLVRALSPARFGRGGFRPYRITRNDAAVYDRAGLSAARVRRHADFAEPVPGVAALLGNDLRSLAVFRYRVESHEREARELASEGKAVTGYVARPATARDGILADAPCQSRSSDGGADESAGSRHLDSFSAGGAAGREHDSQRRLAISRDRPAPGAFHSNHGAAARGDFERAFRNRSVARDAAADRG